MRGCTVHHAVLAEKTRGAVAIDNELKGLVVPSVLPVAVPVLVGALLEGYRRRVVEAHDERGRLDSLKGSTV